MSSCQRVRTVAAGDALLAPSITRRLIEEFVSAPALSAQPPANSPTLTPRELEVLEAGRPRALQRRNRGELYLSEATVKTHVARALAKLESRDRVQAVILAYEQGLVPARR